MTDKLPPALDVACGARSFYFDKDDERVLKCDAHPRHLTLCDGRTLDVSPDIVADFRELPYPDKSFSLVIFDPPHLDVGAGWQVDKYGKLSHDSWREDLDKGFRECLRVLKPYGVLVFKWYEYHIPLKDVLKLCPAKPIIGNRRPKASKTHWVLFMREPETLEQAALSADDYIDNQTLALAT
jgi:putative methyltransferase|nr:MAG TPA: Methyltransferase domain [Caudoviricetes sp.]